MGVRRYTYLGPYVTGRLRPRPHTWKIRSCQNEACSQHGTNMGPSVKFCSACGSSIESLQRNGSTYGTVYDLVEDYLFQMGDLGSDRLFHLAPNVNRKPPRPLHIDEDSEVHLDLQTCSPDAEKEWFEKAFAEEIAVLREKCNDVKIGWGLHHYFM